MVRDDEGSGPLLRRGLLWLAGLVVVGIAVELAADRHWTQPVQLIAWAALLLTGVAAVLVGRPTRTRVRVARALAVLVILASVIGVWEHVESNYDAGELDYVYADAWGALSEPNRWWLAVSKTVGPSPPFAPGALAQAALCVLLATVRHPTLRPESA
jgi:hypothetical protein